jgi:hypothetical protein
VNELKMCKFLAIPCDTNVGVFIAGSAVYFFKAFTLSHKIHIVAITLRNRRLTFSF